MLLCWKCLLINLSFLLDYKFLKVRDYAIILIFVYLQTCTMLTLFCWIHICLVTLKIICNRRYICPTDEEMEIRRYTVPYFIQITIVRIPAELDMIPKSVLYSAPWINKYSWAMSEMNQVCIHCGQVCFLPLNLGHLGLSLQVKQEQIFRVKASSRLTGTFPWVCRSSYI